MKYIIDVPDEVPVSDELVPFDMCRPSWYLEAYEKGKADAEDEVWDFVSRLIWSFVDREILGMDIALAVRDMTYQEAKAKYEAWRSRFVTINNKKYKIVKEGDGKCILEEI